MIIYSDYTNHILICPVTLRKFDVEVNTSVSEGCMHIYQIQNKIILHPYDFIKHCTVLSKKELKELLECI